MPDEPLPTTVTAALSRVMAELPAISKDGRADPAQGGYAYRGIEQITREAQRLFAKYGVVFAPRVTSHVIKDIIVNNKPWTDTILTVAYDVYGPSHCDEREDFITVGPLVAIGRDNSDKGANKAMTQAFKYALLQVLCISDANDDTDGTTHEADIERTVADDMLASLQRQIDSLDDDARDRVRAAWKESHLPPMRGLTQSTFGAADKLVQAEIIAAHRAVNGDGAADAVASPEKGLERPESPATPKTVGSLPGELSEALRGVPVEVVERAIEATSLLPLKAVTSALQTRGVEKPTGNVNSRRAHLAALMAVEEHAQATADPTDALAADPIG